MDGDGWALIGVGHDLQSVSELGRAEAMRRPGLFFTDGELRYSQGQRRPLESLAAIFSAKEALFKALPEAEGFLWTDIEVVRGHGGAPAFRLCGRLGELFSSRRWRAHLSTSGGGDYVAAVAMIEGSKPMKERESAAAPEATRAVSPSLMDEAVSVRLPVRPNDLDSVGHVNNAVVLEYLEAGRWAWLERLGLPRRGRVVLVVARIEIDYRREIFAPEVVVTTRLDGARELLDSASSRFKCVLHQTVEVEPDTPAAEADVSVAFIDVETRTIRSLRDYLNAAGVPHDAPPQTRA